MNLQKNADVYPNPTNFQNFSFHTCILVSICSNNEGQLHTKDFPELENDPLCCLPPVIPGFFPCEEAQFYTLLSLTSMG